MSEKPLDNCPFCAGRMMFRKALWPSDGDTDAIIHAFNTNGARFCGMDVFTTYTADESIIELWNRRAPAPSDGPGPSSTAVDDQLVPHWKEST